MDMKLRLKKAALNTAIDYLDRNPEQNLEKLMDWVDKLAGKGPGTFENQRAVIRGVIQNPEGSMYKLVMNIFRDTDKAVLKKVFENFFLNAVILGWKKQDEYREKYGCNIPWAILMDPTSACNLHCLGCWAAEYGNKLNLSYEELSGIVSQGKEFGTYMYLMTGGEPLARKADIIRLCREHGDCQFLAFTNGTLIDEKFADEMLQLKNFIPAISVEGFEEATDFRRGSGTYKAVIKAMEILKRKRLPFGVSCCYTSKNIDSLASEEFIDHLVECGAKFAWFFHYMPVGNSAATELLPSPSQREFICRKIRGYRSTKPIFTIDFQNDAEYAGGCIAGGRRYLHISADGAVEPCAFVHYADSNIREKTLLEAFRSPLFMAFHNNQPFNSNHFRPCPMLENPEYLEKMAAETGAASTDVVSPESAEHICAKCRPYAEKWKPKADELWAERCEKKAAKKAISERMEDECDAAVADEAYKEYLKDPKTYTHEEAKKLLGL